MVIMVYKFHHDSKSPNKFKIVSIRISMQYVRDLPFQNIYVGPLTFGRTNIVDFSASPFIESTKTVSNENLLRCHVHIFHLHTQTIESLKDYKLLIMNMVFPEKWMLLLATMLAISSKRSTNLALIGRALNRVTMNMPLTINPPLTMTLIFLISTIVHWAAINDVVLIQSI